MDITAEEKLMYSIMKAIYESNIPVSFKGSMVLRSLPDKRRIYRRDQTHG